MAGERASYRSDRARRVYRSPGALLISGAPFVLALLTVFTALAMGDGSSRFLAVLAAPMIALGVAGFGATYSRRAYVDLRGDVVSVEQGALSIDGSVVVERGEIEQAFVLPHDGAVWVEIERRGRSPVTIRVDDDADGRALLTALGFDATQAKASFRALSGFYTWPASKQTWVTLGPVFGLLVPSVLLFAAAGPQALPYAVLAFLVGAGLFLRLFTSARVTIGADGIRHRWLQNENLYTWQEVERIDRWASPDELHTYSGLKLTLKTGQEVVIGAGKEGWNADAADQLVLRAQEAWALSRASRESDRLPVLERGARDGVAWVQHLRALGAGGGGHQRDNFVAPETLIRIVEDASQPALSRASALVAARSQLSPEELERVRVVANTTIDDPLREAIDCALDDASEEAALAEALLALEPAQAQKA